MVITVDTANDSIKSTRDSRLIPTIVADGEAIAHEQARLTEDISKAMSKKLVALFACRYQARARTTVYTGTKNGTINGWLRLTKHFLERVHAKSPKAEMTWGIIDHLE